MWDKPRELTEYLGNGYEISIYSTATVTPRKAIDGWKSSPKHNDVIVGNGYWDKLTCMGIAIEGSYSHVWFGAEEDPEGYY